MSGMNNGPTPSFGAWNMSHLPLPTMDPPMPRPFSAFGKLLSLASLAATIASFAQAAEAATPEKMMQQCRIRAGKVLRMRLPDIDTKYEGQRVDGSQAVNGTGRTAKRTVTFQCNFNRSGSQITKFVVNKPVTPEPPPSTKPVPRKVKAACLAAVGKQVGSRGVSVISARRGETSFIVLVKVSGAQAPWRCDHDGTKVIRVLYTAEG